MNRAIELAASAVENGNHPFGAILVIDDHIVLEAENTVLTESDLTRHAEMDMVYRPNGCIGPGASRNSSRVGG
jgi:tRNA(Arg) A34 adenosine deaminase TadA